MKKVFVSGCYDILHAGHIQFFKEAKALGDYLIVSFAGDSVLKAHKNRVSSLPQDHKKALLESLDMVDEVVVGEDHGLGLDFRTHFLRLKPDILAVTEDDKYETIKKALCAETGTQYVVLPKTPPQFTPISTTQIVRRIKAPLEVPLRIDFAGGWLDVPRYARKNSYIVNCSITPAVSLTDWPYHRGGGLGGSGAWAILNGVNGIDSELNLRVGWQDPAIIQETGLCVWRSGEAPVLDMKVNPDFLHGRMALYWTGEDHDTPSNVDRKRNYDWIEKAALIAREAVISRNIVRLADAIKVTHEMQMDEKMNPLPEFASYHPLARKYCGGGFGGYAVYLFETEAERDRFTKETPETLSIEPYIKM